MPTPVDDLKPGDDIVVLGLRNVPLLEQCCQTGGPLSVIHADDLPFMVVQDLNGRRFTIDVRAWDVQRVSKKYVESIRGGTRPTKRAKSKSPEAKGSGDDGHRRCGKCGERMRQRMAVNKDTQVARWRWFCPHCDADAGPVKK